MNEAWNNGALLALGASAALYAAARVRTRLQLSLAKHRSLAGHPRMARRVAALLKTYQYDEAKAFGVDGASDAVVAQRRSAFAVLSREYGARFVQSSAQTALVQGAMPDLQFTSAYRVPFQFRELARKALKAGSFVASSHGVFLTDLDGNEFYDLTGSYGVNLFGHDFYKDCMARGAALVADLGLVLGAYHPVVADNVQRLQKVSGMDAVTFHMSGTEAVMQAVRLARYHSKRSHLVRFCGSYHGWWGDVQPGIGNPQTARDTYTLKEMDGDTLGVLRRRNDIACVLVNPLQALHPNAAAPSDSSLLDSSRRASYSREAYTQWLKQLREVCTAKGIALIFDEVFMGFRLAPGGAQAYFGVQADLVTYGKTLGGGFPVGVVCGKDAWMRRFREDAPADICFARGTFNSHPAVMGAMNEFLRSLDTEAIQALYQGMDARWDGRAQRLNQRLRDAALPLQVANMSTVWTVVYTHPACFNWLLQYYLRLQGLALSWVGSGRLIFSLDFSDADFDEVAERFVRAAQAMKNDGWWSGPAGLSNKAIKRRLLRELLHHLF